MDQNHINFTNGVFDLVKRIFTPCKVGNTEITTTYPYHESSQEVREFIKLIISDMFLSEQSTNNFLRECAKILFGNERLDKCLYFEGTNSTGKTFITDLLGNMLGDYCIYISRTTLAKNIGDDFSIPRFVGSFVYYYCKNKKLIIYTEVYDDDKINHMNLRRLLDKDSHIEIRQLYKLSEPLNNTFAIILSGNSDIKFCDDTDYLELITRVEFPVEFVEDLKGTHPGKKQRKDIDQFYTENYYCALFDILYENMYINIKLAKR